MVLQLDHAGAPTQRYLWAEAVDHLLAAETVDDGGAEDVVWSLGDHQNTIRDLVTYDPLSGDTTVANHVTYDSFGNVTAETNAAAVDHLFGYTGRLFDEATGLQNNLNRWYNPQLGRWLTEDPIGFEGGDGNLYRYCATSPIGSIDPSGLADDATDGHWYDWFNPWAWGEDYGERIGKGILGANELADIEQKFKTAAISREEFIRQQSSGNGRELQQDTRMGAHHARVMSGLNDIAREAGDALDGAVAAGELTGDVAGLVGIGVGVSKNAMKRGAKKLVEDVVEETSEKAPRELHRPYIRKKVREKVEARAPRAPDGRPIDPNTLQPIDGTPDLGHKPGHEFWREKARAEAEELLQKQFNDRMNDPDLYQLEDPSSNRSHRYETPR
ncbi:MAG: RHS repeat-associated core domain-containing protein [Patescibacteria group bacterium]|nr:RHS repeat-associated core domain-containing protein [Patescibacteria group bacterium]